MKVTLNNLNLNPSTLSTAEEISKITGLNLTCISVNADEGTDDETDEEIYCDEYVVDDASEDPTFPVVLLINVSTKKFNFIVDAQWITAKRTRLSVSFDDWGDTMTITDKKLKLFTFDNLKLAVSKAGY